MAQLQFDARSVAPDTGTPEAIPAGWYNVIIDQSENKPTNDGQGMYLEARYNVLDGQYAGRKVFSRFNLRNVNPQAQEIAYKQLSAVCHAVGVLQVQDSQQLHNMPMKIKVSKRDPQPKINKDTGQPTGEYYDASNDVKAWKNINEPVDTAPAGAPAMPMGHAMPAAAPAAPQGWGAPAAAPAQAAAPAPWQGGAPAGAPAQPWAAQPPAAAPAQPWQGGPPAGAPQQQWAPPPVAAPAQPQHPQQPPAGSTPWAPAAGAAPDGNPATATPPWATQR